MTGVPRTATDPLARVTWPVTTARLALRRLDPADAEALWSYRQLEDVDRWLGVRPRDLDTWRSHLGEAPRAAQTLVVEHAGAVVGDLYLAVRDGWAQSDVADRAAGAEAEVGWVLDPAHQGRGLATEAVRALLRVCFADLGLRRVTASAFAANAPSWRLMERVGMRREAVGVRDSLHHELGWIDGVTYALLAEEWTAAPPAAN
ncbi:GNAT family N-acetyltransferase [Cellulosimicrobium sp. CUA-896]|uniref:GNAT family N-acetyltransferase n=1 Tax=Cellulosimicrobium sp. CUA-896 TaxID=1517881 RepID=UPI00095994D6|nr:GNAT family protein [Cellulosimicrobium sp. CUA-896]OLT52422.1 GNAT family N-acetyltransferase [Cellulosimicrobium sp. CUA-896]